jgi:hypothetical protein
MTFPDHFSDHADLYEAFRPAYPEALFAYLTSLVPAHDLAWDCATGNGQAAVALTPRSSPPTTSPGTAPRATGRQPWR